MTLTEKDKSIQYISKLLELIRSDKIEAIRVSQNREQAWVWQEYDGPVHETITFDVTHKGPTPEMIEQREKEEREHELKELKRLKLKYES